MNNNEPIDTLSDWYCGIDGRRIGPMHLDDLRALVARGAMRPFDLVWHPSFGENWRKAIDVPELEFPPPGGMPPPLPFPKPEPVQAPTTPLCGVQGNRPSAVETGARAWRRMKAILFHPFSFVRWCGIALAAFFASVGGGGSINIKGDPLTLARQLQSIHLSELTTQDLVNFARDALSTDPATAIISLPLSIAFSLLFLLLFCWVRANGTFMLLHKLHRPDAFWGEAWRVGRPGGIVKSLFLWRVAIGAVVSVATLLVIGGGALFGYKTIGGSDEPLAWLSLIVAVGSILAALGAIYSLVLSLTDQFLVPIMYWRQVAVRKAWKTFCELCAQYGGAIVRYYLLLFVWKIAAGFALLGIMLITLGAYFFLLLIPFVSALALLPVTVFFRSTGMEFLRQWRPDLLPPNLDKVAPGRTR